MITRPVRRRGCAGWQAPVIDGSQCWLAGWLAAWRRLLLKLNAGADKFKAQAQASDFVVHAHAEHAEPGKAKAS